MNAGVSTVPRGKGEAAAARRAVGAEQLEIHAAHAQHLRMFRHRAAGRGFGKRANTLGLHHAMRIPAPCPGRAATRLKAG
jgi:hypothetical protein